MKKNKSKDLRELGKSELMKNLAQWRHDLFAARLQQVNQQLKDPLKLRNLRRGIAQIMTILKEKGDR